MENSKNTKNKTNDPKLFKSLGMEKARRPNVTIQPNVDDIVFMQIDVDCDSYSEQYGVDSSKYDEPLIRIYGVTNEGNSVCCLVEDFYPYIFTKLPSGIHENDLGDLKNLMNNVMKNLKNFDFPVKKLEIVERIDLKFYNEYKEKFLKITFKNSKYVSSMRELLESQENIRFKYKNSTFDFKTYESKLSFPLRYMIDNEIVGMSWLTLKSNKYFWRNDKQRISNCQIEVSISYKDVIAHEPEGEFAKIAPIRVLSFDIESASKGGHFPKADKDPVIQIANYCVEFGKNGNKSVVNSLFSYKKCAEIPGADVHSYEDEINMLRAWKNFIVELDPDIITGYNINNFDFPYLFDRADHLKISDFGKLSRIKSTNTKARHVGANSAKAFNNRELISINMDGRSIIDMYLLIVKDHKLRSNTLNNVSFHFLKEQKEDVHHTMIYGLWNTDELTRKRLGLYCLKDALLPWKLCEKLMIIYNYAEMCRVTCTPLNFILSRGQQIKVLSQLHRKAKNDGYIIPNEKPKFGQNSNDDEKGYDGASVLEPLCDFYKDPIVTLDFASLYPSIMIAHNLCYTTLVRDNDVKKYNPDHLYKSPMGYFFIKKEIREGILPKILTDLINSRKKTKKELKEAVDENVKAVLDGRQLALKISANSVYGFTGAQVGQLPCIEISATVTSVGRSMIERTRDFVLERFNKQNGYQNDSVVVYGDTDSVMIKFGVKTLEEAMKLGQEASDRISEIFTKPIKIEFEKVYKPYLLMKKKRYAGLIWTKLDKWDKIDTKGLESVRRDNCELVRDLLDKCMNMLLLDEDGVNKSIEYCKATISDLLLGRVDLSKLIISKSISKKTEDDDDDKDKDSINKGKSVKGKTYVAKQAHVELAEKMKKRDEGTAPSIGDRVSYVMVSGIKGSKNYENAEDPKYVLEQDKPIDHNYYIENQLKKPLLRLYEYIIKDAEAQLFCTFFI